MESLFEQLGGTYTRQGDYCLPDVCLPPEEERPISVYGQRRRVYLREHHRVLYYNLLLANDVPLKQIQEWLGHSDFTTTANIYSHLDYKSKITSANVMDNILTLPDTRQTGWHT